jgi:hypothetical protein
MQTLFLSISPSRTRPFCASSGALDESEPVGLPAISVAHYGQQNGDLMRDPEMCDQMAPIPVVAGQTRSLERQRGADSVHDLRRTFAKLCRKNSGDLEQIKFLLGHSSVQTTERYLGSDQEIAVAVNDTLGAI